MLFVKAAKLVALSLTLAPLTGCALATGNLYAAYLTACATAPDQQNSFFGTTLLGFALIETFCFLSLGVAGLIFVY